MVLTLVLVLMDPSAELLPAVPQNQRQDWVRFPWKPPSSAALPASLGKLGFDC